MHVLKGHTDGVNSVCAFGNDMLASASGDKTVRIWDADSGKCLHILRGHTASVQGVCDLGNGRLASASEDNTVRIWQVWIKKDIRKDLFTGKNMGTGNYVIRSTCLRILEGHRNFVWSVCSFRQGTLLASTSSDDTVRVWDVTSGECLRILVGHTHPVLSVCALDDNRLVSASDDNTLLIWDVTSGVSLRELDGHTFPVTSVCVLDNGLLASGSWDRTVRIWNAESGECLRVLTGHTGYVDGVCALSDGRLASASWDRTVRVWDAESGECLSILGGHMDFVKSVCALSEGRLASASRNQRVRIWSSAEVTGHDIRFRNALTNIKNVNGRRRAKTAREVLNRGTRGNSRLINTILSYLPGSVQTRAPNRFNSKVYNEEQELFNEYPNLKGFIPRGRNAKVPFIERARNFMETNPNMNELTAKKYLREIRNSSRKNARNLRNRRNASTRRRN